MTVLGHGVPVWLAWVLIMLVTAGVGTVVMLAAAGLERGRDWWRDRRSPNPDYDGDGWDYPDDGPGDDDDLDGSLPPERSWEQMTSHKWRVPWWEAEPRDAYESLGLEYPSGLMARVRELAP